MKPRRGLARLAVTLGLMAATLAWWGLTLQRTAFDSSRSEELVTTLADDPNFHRAMVDAAVLAIDGSLPIELRRSVPTEDLAKSAELALATPAVQESLRAALVDTHRYILGEIDEPPVLTAAPLDAALRAQLVAVRPDLAGVAGQLPPLEVQLPAGGVPYIQTLGVTVGNVTSVATFAALLLLALGLVLAPERGSMLRKIGWWGVTVGGIWVAIRYGLPALGDRIFPDSAALLRALITVMADGMAQPGLVLLVGGAMSVIVGFAAERLKRAGAERAIRKRRELAAGLENPGLAGFSGASGSAASLLQPPETATVAHRPMFPPLSPAERRDPAAVLNRALQGQEPRLRNEVAAPSPERPEIKRRRADADPEDDPASWLGGFSVNSNVHPALSAPPPPPPPGPRWVEGYGYVFDSPPYEGAMWVAGVGYVVPPDELERVHPRRR